MFKKNDPLVEVSKKIMQENETRRQVVLLVNESLGIEDKKVLPRELFAEYDTILAEAQSVALKEGIDRVQLDEVTIKAIVKKVANELPSRKKKIEDLNRRAMNKPTIKGWANAQKRVNAAVNEEQLDELSRKTLKSYVGKAKKSLDTLNSKADKYSDIADRYSDRMYNATKSKTRKEYERKSDAANSKVIGFENKASIRDAGVKQARDRLRGTYTAKHKYKLDESVRTPLPKVYKKKAIKEDTSIEAINEEIYDNLLANLIEAYQSSEDAFNDMVDSLTEEQLQILGFTEGIQ